MGREHPWVPPLKQEEEDVRQLEILTTWAVGSERGSRAGPHFVHESTLLLRPTLPARAVPWLLCTCSQ